MYVVVPQLKNRQIEIGHGCFYPLANDGGTSQSCHFFGTDPPTQQNVA